MEYWEPPESEEQYYEATLELYQLWIVMISLMNGLAIEPDPDLPISLLPTRNYSSNTRIYIKERLVITSPEDCIPSGWAVILHIYSQPIIPRSPSWNYLIKKYQYKLQGWDGGFRQGLDYYFLLPSQGEGMAPYDGPGTKSYIARKAAREALIADLRRNVSLTRFPGDEWWTTFFRWIQAKVRDIEGQRKEVVQRLSQLVACRKEATRSESVGYLSRIVMEEVSYCGTCGAPLPLGGSTCGRCLAPRHW